MRTIDPTKEDIIFIIITRNINHLKSKTFSLEAFLMELNYLLKVSLLVFVCKYPYPMYNTTEVIFSLSRPWCNSYRHRIWTRRYEFNSWTRLIAFHIALIPLGKV